MKDRWIVLNYKDLLSNKRIIDEKNSQKTKTFNVKSLEKIGDGKVIIRSIDDEEYDAIDRSSKTEYEMNMNAVYRAVVEPDLRNAELHKAYEVMDNPVKIVRKIFSRAEVNNIANEIAKLSSMVQKKDLIKEVKND